MPRKTEMSVYADAAEVVDIEAAAEDAGLSVSKYILSHVPEASVDE